jgi:hypothetical protein
MDKILMWELRQIGIEAGTVGNDGLLNVAEDGVDAREPASEQKRSWCLRNRGISLVI